MSPYTETLNTLIYQNSFEHVFFFIKDYFKIGQNYKHWETSAFRTKNPVVVICSKDHVYVKDLRHHVYLICASSDIINFKDHLCQLDSQQDLGTLGWECLDHRLCLHICHVQRRTSYKSEYLKMNAYTEYLTFVLEKSNWGNKTSFIRKQKLHTLTTHTLLDLH